MNSECREYVKRHIDVQLEKEPDISLAGMFKYLLSGSQDFDLQSIKINTLKKFIRYNMDKFKEAGTMPRKQSSGGNGKIRGRVACRIKQLIINKKWRGIRKVAARVGWSS